MSNSFTNFLETKILEHVFTNTPYTPPPTIYLGLFLDEPDESGSGTEVSGGSYQRMAVPLTVSGNTVTNDDIVEFPTATSNWGTIVAGALFDAATNGNMLVVAPLQQARVIETGDVFRLPLGDLTITLD